MSVLVVGQDGGHSSAVAPVTTAIKSAPASASASPTMSPSPSAASHDRLTRSLQGYLDGRGGRLSVAIRDLSTGVSYTYGKSRRYVTASIVKADILAALLLKAQQAGRPLTSAQRSLASRMIRDSDNAAASALWQVIGGTEGLAKANKKLGLRETQAGTGGYWGMTETTAGDQIRLLAALVSADSPLKASYRRYALSLMESVSSGQDWGVSAAARTGDEVAVKNGWLPRSADGGLWVVHSIGRVHGGGHDYLIAVLSDRNPSMTSGVEIVEHVAGLVARQLL